jgi:PadR family transcriptional regulator PadR
LISNDVIRGYTDIIILNLLLQNDSYGYEISKQIRIISEEKYVIKETTLYSAFTRLQKAGYIESYEGTKTNGKKRVYYHITEEGISHYARKCREWSEVKELVDKFAAVLDSCVILKEE